ncbi:MAG: S-layer homology domain-containing protein [Candidatus Eremiobacteraeota bacterium]|nr:S-layer homology domain-containing protein [Candidatus Eremiobacteraeota bacterium]
MPSATNRQTMYRYRAFAALFAAGLLMTACTQSSNSSAQSSASPESSAAATAAVAESPMTSAPPATASGAMGEAESPAANSGTPVSYTDLNGVFGQKEITELAALGVFGTPNGNFNPAGTITRAEFAKWLVLANNAIFVNDSGKQISPSQGTSSAYPDVATSNPNFSYIQGLYDAGFAVGYPDKTFKPDALLTHEQLIAMKESVDRGGLQQYYVSNWDSTMPDWKDKAQINKLFRGAIAEDNGLDRSAVLSWGHPNLVIGNVPRTFGAIAMFRPQQPATRAQAALVLWKIGPHNDHISNPTTEDMPRSAADALAPPTPTPTP